MARHTTPPASNHTATHVSVTHIRRVPAYNDTPSRLAITLPTLTLSRQLTVDRLLRRRCRGRVELFDGEGQGARNTPGTPRDFAFLSLDGRLERNKNNSQKTNTHTQVRKYRMYLKLASHHRMDGWRTGTDSSSERARS